MSNYVIKACTKKSYRRNNAIAIGVVAVLSCFGLGMAIFNFVKGNVLFGISYTIAIILGFTYVMIKSNTVFATFMAADKKYIYLKNWVNGFLPYAVNCKVKIFSEFIPARTEIIEIPITEITEILIGTKNFIKRYADDGGEFMDAIAPYESTKDFYKKKTVHSMDIFFVDTYESGSYFMPIMNFNTRDVVKLLQVVERRNPNVDIKVNSKEFRKLKSA